MVTQLNAHRRLSLGLILALAISATAFTGLTSTANADPLLPGPSIISGPTEGETINTDSVQFLFDYLEPITNGSLTDILCSVDGAPEVVCTDGLNLVGLEAGAHTIGAKARLSLLGGAPLCVLTICIDPGPVSVDTDLLTRTFNVDVGGTSVGTDPPSGSGGSGANGANGANGVNGAGAGRDRTAEFLVAWTKYKNQRALCNRQKNRIKRYKSKKNRASATKRYKKCVKRQNTLRAAAIAITR